MLRIMKKSKIHRATVTQSDLNYVGSITIDGTLMDQADIMEDEKVLVVDINNGARFETYVLRGENDSGVICLNGAGARLAYTGDKIIIISFAMYNEEELAQFHSKSIHVDEKNRCLSIE